MAIRQVIFQPFLTDPTPSPVLMDGEVTFDLIITTSNINPGVAGADIYLSYDAPLVVPPASPRNAAEARPDFFGVSNVSINESLPAAQCPGGARPCIHLVLAGTPQVNQSGVAARFHFLGMAEGTPCFTVIQSTLVDEDGFQVNHEQAATKCVPVLFRSALTGMVKRQGTPANPNPGNGSLACSIVSVLDPPTTIGSVYTDTQGGFSLPGIPIGTHTLRATYPGYLPSEKTINITGSSLSMDVGSTTLRGGDVNTDSLVNILDIGVIVSKFGQTGAAVKSASASCSGSDDPVDINDDGAINISDLAIVAGNWGLTGPTVWP